ncbi:MAG: RluA family pseudouridine synthase [Moraxellaceae bacterium]|nr:RluA family pseudouridine synthase [Moraxellaceae bacterium]
MLPSFPPLVPAPLRVLYADEVLLVASKPCGLLSVPGLGEDKQDCLIARLLMTFPDARIVHRLDRDTSGLLVLGRNADSHRELSRQFQDREVDKRYIALALGNIAEVSGEIDLPLRYDPPTKPRHVVDVATGQPSLTRWRVLAQLPGCTRVELEPFTGRSHQLRVHMQALGHPLLGDPLYAPPEAVPEGSRLCLHAERLSFTHPGHGGRLHFRDPAPF